MVNLIASSLFTHFNLSLFDFSSFCNAVSVSSLQNDEISFPPFVFLVLKVCVSD